MPNLPLVSSPASPPSVTLTELYARLEEMIKDTDARFTDEEQRTALRRAFTDVLPLGVKTTKTVTLASSAQIIFADLLIGQPTACRVRRSGNTTWQDVPVQVLRCTRNSVGATLINFPNPITGDVELTVWVQPPLPNTLNDLVLFPWPDLLVTYAAMNLFLIGAEAGGRTNSAEWMALIQRYQMQADNLKMSIAIAEGIMQPVDDKPTGGKKK